MMMVKKARKFMPVFFMALFTITCAGIGPEIGKGAISTPPGDNTPILGTSYRAKDIAEGLRLEDAFCAILQRDYAKDDYPI